uniref:Ubiquitin-like protease family profile domain-containing protein n=1 Tax=Amphimedon queenslandica TaxID=400682 RepID=A0A1X7VDD2_AMPQE
MTDVLTLLQSSSTYINHLLMKKESEIIDLDKAKVKDSMDTNVSKWIEFGNASLTIQDKDVLTKEEWLSDRHITMAQLLVKNKFPHLNGLRTTLEQKKPLDEPNDKILQVIHINNNHWALISTFGC